MKKMQSLEDLFVEELKDLYDAENQLLKALPKMAKAASSPELQAAFQEHTEVTREQVQRLEKVFEIAEAPARRKKCKGMAGLIEEGKEIMQQDADESVLDAALIAAAQKVEHYEIAGYGTVATYAKLLGLDRAAKLLGQTLEEEKETDERLTGIAEGLVNVEAATPR
jgi:ferritin-like metal-binding protein YciE